MSATGITPLADYVLAQQEEAETKTASGLYLPGGSQEKPKIAKVLAVGKEVQRVKVGDRIIYESYAETKVSVDRTEYMLVKDDKIIATVK